MRDAAGNLCIAKFPKVDEGPVDDVCAWEHVCLRLMAACGISVPESRLLRVGGRAVPVLRRFDRAGEARVPYVSGLTAVQGRDGGRYSYLELVGFLEEEGSRPGRDIRELWLRTLFSCAVGNTDNHLRNHGFLRDGAGWALSPAFDVNPTVGSGEKYLATGLDFDARDADPRLAIEVCDCFRLSVGEARGEAGRMARALSGWRRAALIDGISPASVDAMAGCLDSGVERLERVARG